MIVEGIITLVIVGALLYVTPSVLAAVRASAPIVYAATPQTTVYVNGTVDPQLNASLTSIGTSVAGGVSLSAIAPIMLGIGLMIGAFMIIRNR